MSPAVWCIFVVAGAAGAVTRALVDAAIGRRGNLHIPTGILVVNASGSFALGVITGLALHHGLSRSVVLVAGTGWCGAYTTFSTFTAELARLGEDGAIARASLYLLVTTVMCAATAALGLAMGTIA